MSYSSTLQVQNISSQIRGITTPTRELYPIEFMSFVAEAILSKSESRKENDGEIFDIDSRNLVKAAKKYALRFCERGGV
ncbi:MAG: hypothetical protein AB7V56_09355 [Candidatus Nitrosocosmicus sp.]